MRLSRATSAAIIAVTVALGALGTGASAQAQLDPLEAADAPSTGEVTSSDRPLSHGLSPWLAVAIGAIGSLAYLFAAYIGFIGSDATARERILVHFRARSRLTEGLKVAVFAFVGGSVAMVFQATESNLVPVQAFIIGCTWPAVVANYISAKQSGGEHVEERVAETLRAQEHVVDDLEMVADLPDPEPSPEDRAALDELLAGLADGGGR